MSDSGWISRSGGVKKAPAQAAGVKQAFSAGPHVPGIDEDTTVPVEDTTLPADEVREIEARAQVDSLGNLQYRRRQLLDVLSPLKALHGPFGLFDDRRKQLLETMKIRARMALTADGAKTTEAAVDARAYADEQYERFLDNALDARIEYLKMENELSDINERISSREAELYFVGKEMGLSR